MKYMIAMGLAVLVAGSAHAYDSGNVSNALGYSSSSARSTSGYRSGGIRGLSFYKRGSHVSSFGKGGQVTPCINCKGASGIKYRIITAKPNPPLPSGNWRYGHGPNYRTSRR
ncbi:MAG: hypothetical protein VX730_04165 [Pseudomonadota bacterium]|nr:hypothetical protein [Pseudomonadota bacterium]